MRGTVHIKQETSGSAPGRKIRVQCQCGPNRETVSKKSSETASTKQQTQNELKHGVYSFMKSFLAYSGNLIIHCIHFFLMLSF